MLLVVTLTALPSLFLGRLISVSSHTASDIHRRAEIRSGQKRKDSKRGGRENHELIRRNESGDRSGDELHRVNRRRHGLGLANAAVEKLEG